MVMSLIETAIQKRPQRRSSLFLSLLLPFQKTAPKLVNRALKMTKRFKQTRNHGFMVFLAILIYKKNVISCWNLTYISNLQIQAGMASSLLETLMKKPVFNITEN